MNRGNGIVGFIVLIAIIWGVYSLFSGEDENEYLYQEHPNYESYSDSGDCDDLEPDNPYSYDSGHYAGFEWGAEGNYCDGNSTSFIEGCEEYYVQEEAYEMCLDS